MAEFSFLVTDRDWAGILREILALERFEPVLDGPYQEPIPRRLNKTDCGDDTALAAVPGLFLRSVEYSQHPIVFSQRPPLSILERESGPALWLRKWDRQESATLEVLAGGFLEYLAYYIEPKAIEL